jgi:hypothetical protein
VNTVACGCFAAADLSIKITESAEGVGLLPTIGKTLKINGRLSRYVVQDYRTGVTVGKGDFAFGTRRPIRTPRKRHRRI